MLDATFLHLSIDNHSRLYYNGLQRSLSSQRSMNLNRQQALRENNEIRNANAS